MLRDSVAMAAFQVPYAATLLPPTLSSLVLRLWEVECLQHMTEPLV